MPDLILRDIEPSLLERVQRLADARGCSVQQALVSLLERGLACSIDDGLEGVAARVLAEAFIALDNMPNDPGFALIGRAAPTPPPMRDAPDQSVAPQWTPAK